MFDRSPTPVSKRLFVTGGTGFIGSAVIRAAVQRGHQVVAICGQSPSRSDNKILWLARRLNEVTKTDLAGCDTFVHLAAAGVTTGSDDWEHCFEVNVRQSLALWRTAVAAGIHRFVICGSCFEYGRSAENYAQIPVTAPLQPVTAYGASKAAASAAALALAASDSLSLTILRPFHVFGEGEAAGRFWPELRKAAQAGRDFAMTSGIQVRDFTPVALVADQFVAELESMRPPGDPVIRNLGTGRARSLESFARECWAEWGATGHLHLGAVPMRPHEIFRYVPQLD